MGSIIVAMPKLEDAKKIGDMLKSRGMQSVEICTTGAGILTKVHQLDRGIVICTRRFRDMYCSEILENLPETFEMLLLISKDHVEECPENVEMVFLPFRISDLMMTAEKIFAKLDQRLGRKSRRPKQRSKEEQAYIDQAKQVLMERNQMTEPEAFRYLQKCSMDSCTNLVETAQMILLLKVD